MKITNEHPVPMESLSLGVTLQPGESVEIGAEPSEPSTSTPAPAQAAKTTKPRPAAAKQEN